MELLSENASRRGKVLLAYLEVEAGRLFGRQAGPGPDAPHNRLNMLLDRVATYLHQEKQVSEVRSSIPVSNSLCPVCALFERMGSPTVLAFRTSYAHQHTPLFLACPISTYVCMPKASAKAKAAKASKSCVGHALICGAG